MDFLSHQVASCVFFQQGDRFRSRIRLAVGLAALLLVGFSAPAQGQGSPVQVVLDPQNGSGSTAVGENHGYVHGRGVAFSMAEDYAVTSFSVQLNTVSSINVFYELAEVNAFEDSGSGPRPAGQVVDVTVDSDVLASGTQAVSTSGLEWVEFAISPPLLLSQGAAYHLEVSFPEAPDSHFFYSQGSSFDGRADGTDNFDTAPFLYLNGTSAGHTANTALASFRVSVVPEPSTNTVLGIALGMAAFRFVRSPRFRNGGTSRIDSAPERGLSR